MATRAVIDIGANSTKLLVAKITDGVVSPAYRARDVTRLSEDFFESRRLRPEAIRRTADAVGRFVSQALRYDPESIRIVATSAARDALNRSDLTCAIELSTGIPVQIISGEQEAQWAYEGVLSDPVVPRQAGIVFDLGGGSTEFVVAQNHLVQIRRSYPLGAIRLLQSLKPSEPPSADDLAACRNSATQFIAEFVVPGLHPALDAIPRPQRGFVGCGGTACALQRILCRGTLETPTSIFRLPALQALIVRLWSIPRTQRVAEGVAATRADSILTGSVIVESLMQCLDISEISVSSYGMRHGALLAMSSDETSSHQASLQTSFSDSAERPAV